MAEKTFDVNDSKTKDNAYDVKSSTEPDATGDLAMNKEAGEGDYSTTANSRNNEPIAGATTEPDEFHKAAECCDNACGHCKGPGCGCCADCKKIEKAAATTCDSCGGKSCPECKKAMSICKCGDMKKDAMPSDSSGSTSVTASADEDEDDKIKKNFVDEKEIKKSLWGGAFIPL